MGILTHNATTVTEQFLQQKLFAIIISCNLFSLAQATTTYSYCQKFPYITLYG